MSEPPPPSSKENTPPRQTTRRVGLIVAALLLVAGGWLGIRLLWPFLFPPSPLVLTPVLALESLQTKSLYYNPPALPWLRQKRDDLLTDEDRDLQSAHSRAFRQAVQDPKLFRQLDRQIHFDTVLLLDDPSQFTRLLDHLMETQDFKLVYVDHWALVFRRDAPREWTPADGELLHQKLSTLRSSDRATVLAKAARRLLAVRQPNVAKQWLDEALKLDSSSVDALAGQADYAISLGRWNEALASADKALEQKEDDLPALAAKLQALRATKHFADAFLISTQLNTLIPEDPVRLWQHAETAREARKYEEQIKALNRLITLATAEERPTGLYEFYLGEAHSHAAMDNGLHAAEALAHLRKAVADPLLAEEHRKFAEERIKTIQERTGLK